MNWNFYNKTPSKKSKKRNQKFSKIKKKKSKIFKNQKKRNQKPFKNKKKEIKKSKKTKNKTQTDFIAHLITYVCIEIILMFLYSFVCKH